MAWQAWGIALLLMATGFAGCLSKDDVSTAETEDIGPELNTTAPDGRGKLIAFEETNMTETGADGVDHHHDHWGQDTRKVVFERVVMLDPLSDVPGTVFGPPQGTFIYEGTATVEVTITEPMRHVCEPLITFGGHFYCTDYLGEGTPAAPPVPDPAPPTGLKLRYQHASTVDWIDVGELAWGVPLPIKITDARQTDMPHATSSVWRFEIVSPNALDSTLTFKTKAEIVRAEGEIPLWPPHPLFYTPEKPSRVVVENAAAVACDGGLSGTGCLLSAGESEPVIPSKLISYGTRTLYVWVNITNVVANNPATTPNGWVLHHINATGGDNITDPRSEAYTYDKRELFWVLPVDDGSMDSPYADGSRWEFFLGAGLLTPDTPVRRGTYCYGGCAEWTAEYTINVIASSEDLGTDAYHWNCLDPAVSTCPAP